MLNRDLADLYETETKALNLAVKRNIKRFPADFMRKIKERLGEHDTQLNHIYDAMENLLDEKAAQRKWDDRERIGFKK